MAQRTAQVSQPAPHLGPDARRIAWYVFATACAVMLARILFASYPESTRRLLPEERLAVAATVERLEPEWRLSAQKLYPVDRWSQDDDFHNSERRWVRDEAARRRVPQSEIFDVIDHDLRTEPGASGRRATAAPCKPRPFYD